ncbi:MAG: DNA methylase [Desulfofustis sp. PB-SRB1]|nr:DNA methylase [Desulfofustis sp. PB-SRB1]HBH29826.1 DNA methylase [Desulfofustis sp.]HBH32878.1 DNA methylase [Desulfofustis sp.]
MFETDRLVTHDSGPVTCLGMTFENDEKRREYFLERLREKLKDPEFRKIEGFPIGEDEDILALSDPPYYTACPNPFIEDFITHYGKPYDSTIPYSREPFAADVSEGKNDPIYNAHAYHTKVSYLAIRRYISHFTNPGDLVLDFFSGTGMTGVAAQRCEGGERKCILNDLSSIATHVAGAFTSPFSLNWIAPEAKQALNTIRSQYDWMYETQHCGWPAGERDPKKRIHQIHGRNNQKGTINFVVWSDVFLCPECGSDINFWKTAVDFQKKRVVDDFKCPSCHVLLKKRGMTKAMTTVYDSALKQTLSVAKQEPVLINYTFNRKRFEKEPDEADAETLSKVDKIPFDQWFPITRMPKGDESRRNDTAGITHVHHFYTKRNLLALSALRGLAESHRALLFWFTSTLPWCGRENRLHMSNYFGKKGGQITSLRGTWYVPSLSIETNVFERFDLRIKSALVECGSRANGCLVSTGSATNLKDLPNNTVDYIFVDPPFGDNLMYSELNCIWEAWLKVYTGIASEAIINKTQQKDLFAYQELMSRSFQEGYRVLKSGRWITIEFHNSKNSVWNAIQEALQNAGFVIADVRTLDKGKGSFKQVTSAGAVKQDLIISAYKPNGGLEGRFKLAAGTEEGVWDFVRTHLKQLPVFVSKNSQAEMIAERQHYLLFDRMVAFHVQRGVTVLLSAAEFYAGLEQRFPTRDGMYFLPDQAAEYDKKRMTVKEVFQLQLFVSDEASAIQWLKQQITKKPQTAGDLKPQFMQEIGGWQKNEKMLELDVLLEQNFLRYDSKGDVPSQIHSYLSSNFKELRNLEKDGPALKAKAKDRWYVPDPNKAGDLEKLRERALMREFEEYRESKQKRLKVFRLEAVRAGFKKAWQERDYATIITVARKIPEKILQEDPKLLMWYDQALTRSGEE